jgi:hypothetical protein
MEERTTENTCVVNRAQGAGEGLGKNSALVQSGWSGSQLPVSVEVTKPGSEDKGAAIQQILVVDPIVLFYEQAPLLGVRFEKTLPASVTTKASDVKIRAVPYFFSTENYGSDDLLYSWTSGSRAVPPAISPNTFTLTRIGEGDQASLIRLTVQNKKRVLQAGDTRVIINFTNQ